MLRKSFPIQIRTIKKRQDNDGNEQNKKEEDQRDEDSDPKKDPENSEDKEEDDDGEKKSDREDEDPSQKDDEEDLTAELIFTTGAPVERSDDQGAFQEVLGLDEDQVDLSYLNSGDAPLLDGHKSGSVSDIIGVITSARLEGDGADRRGVATVRLSSRPAVREIFEDIKRRIIRSCSVGYQVSEYLELEQKDDTEGRTLVANRWKPIEISVVPLPADQRSVFRGRKTLHQEKKDMEVKSKAQDGLSAQEIIAKERQRILGIKQAVKAAQLDESVEQDLSERGVGLNEARKIILEKLAERSKFQSHHTIVAGVQDDSEMTRNGLVDSLLTRHNAKRYPITENGKRFYHLKLVDVARKTLGQHGQMMSDHEVVTRSMMSTSDFNSLGGLLSIFSNRVLRDSFNLAPQTWREWTQQSVARDFRPQFKVMLSDVAVMEPLNEVGEYRAQTLTQGVESVKPTTYGSVIHLSRQMLIDDDLNAFSRIPELTAKSCGELIASKVYGLLADNPMMNTDRVRCFDEKHKNELPKEEISINSLTIARRQMRLQRTMKNNILGLMPKYLLTTANNEIPAQQLINQNFLAGAIEGAIQQKINPFVNTLQLIVEPRLDDLISPDVWFTIADNFPSVEVCFLNGMDAPYVEQQLGFITDGISLKARIDFGAAVIEWRGISRNLGKKKGSANA